MGIFTRTAVAVDEARTKIKAQKIRKNLKLLGKNLTRDVVIIAEIGVNHEGDIDTASKLLRLAAEAGADAAKFQSYSPERLTAGDDAERLARVSRFALSEADHRRLAAEAGELGIAFCSSAVTEDMVPLIAELSPLIKIASGDIDFESVIRSAAATGLPVILSTGNATAEEVERAVEWVRDEIGARPLDETLVLMQCVSAYPAPVEEANVAARGYRKERFGVHVGYSNHVIGPDACFAAVALGASVIEVHFTDRKTGRDFRDHELSFDLADLKELVEREPRIRAALGRPEKRRQPSEEASVLAIRKGVVAARDLDAGTILSRNDLMFARPASEFASRDINSLVGCELTAQVQRGHVIRRESITAK